jgi:hypothetical protein
VGFEREIEIEREIKIERGGGEERNREGKREIGFFLTLKCCWASSLVCVSDLKERERERETEREREEEERERNEKLNFLSLLGCFVSSCNLKER